MGRIYLEMMKTKYINKNFKSFKESRAPPIAWEVGFGGSVSTNIYIFLIPRVLYLHLNYMLGLGQMGEITGGGGAESYLSNWRHPPHQSWSISYLEMLPNVPSSKPHCLITTSPPPNTHIHIYTHIHTQAEPSPHMHGKGHGGRKGGHGQATTCNLSPSAESTPGGGDLVSFREPVFG